LILGRDTSLCQGQKLNLYATQQGAENYLWSTGATGDRLTVGYEGTYWVQVKVGNCLFIDSIKVEVLDTDFAIDQQDTLICEGDKNPASCSFGNGFSNYMEYGNERQYY
jgi:hypothetical protein